MSAFLDEERRTVPVVGFRLSVYRSHAMQFSDFSNAAFFNNPYPLYDEMRAAGPLVKLSAGLYVTGRYSVVHDLLFDRRFGKGIEASVKARYGNAAVDEPIFRMARHMLAGLNPPTHTRLRALVMKSFTARQLERFRLASHEISHRLADALIASDQPDIIRDFAFPLPAQIICTIMNVPLEDAPMLKRLSDDASSVLDVNVMNAEQLRKANESVLELQRYFTALFEARRRNPGDDLISQMVAAEEEGEVMTNEELVANVLLLFVAGHETTTNIIGNSLVSLHRHPEQLILARSNPAILPNVIMECMRHETSVQSTMRVALEDAEVAGVQVARGDVVFVWLGAAHRDPEKFAEPDRLKIDRSFKDVKILSFGGGLHFCLGARLATMEIEAALGTLFSRLPDMRITNLDDLRWHKRSQLRGVESLQIARS
ncbi:cytochrome P450 [Paraburkholderia sp. SOS3]|uniref:cytochrome P450 n=1 Tax=Paraburkholderia sp. SOS3 TaxID=1926494 RepID=UPI001E401CFC|nr:cytochrome P450 [Paraburkholderia sp. SOS3]